MFNFREKYSVVIKWFCLPVLSIIAWQQGVTFLNHEKKFLDPVGFVKDNYGKDFITQYGTKFEEIKKMFPKPTHVTYFGEANEEYNTGAMHYYLSQYYLTPNVLFIDSVGRDTIVYNLYSSLHVNPETNFYLKNGWHIEKNFNNGLIVLVK